MVIFLKETNRKTLINNLANSFPLKKLVKYLSVKISTLMLKAGYYRSPIALIASRLLISIILLMFSFLTLMVYVLSNYVYALYLAFIIVALATLVFISPFLQVFLLIRDRREGLKKELPYFLLYASVLQHAGISMYTSLTRLIKSNVFKYLKKEAMVFLRDVRFLGKDPLTALDNLAKNSPLKEFQDIIYGYTSLIRSGGDVAKYLEEKTKDLLKELKFKWKIYAERSTDIGESIASMFLMLTLLILIGSIILPSDIGLIIVTLNFLVIPIIAIISLIIIDSLLPEILEFKRKHLKYPLIAALLSIPPAYFAYNTFNSLPLVVLIVLLSITLINGISYYRERKIAKSIENALPEFLRDLTEYRKMGFTPAQAIIRISWAKKYNKHFDRLLNNMSSHVRMGLGLNKLPKTCSWLFNYVVFILNEIEESGGGSPVILEELTHFVNEVRYIKAEARKSLFIYELIAYLTPVLLTFSLALVLKLASALIEIDSSYSTFSSMLGLTFNFDEIFEQFKITIIEASLTFALLTSKVIDFTLRNTLRGFFILLIAGLSFIIAPYVSEYIFSIIAS
ncbi:MAG: hypothetical protein DRO23_01840 [Thermoprotei archaeon]|nr:MAG: hypothetical protein DRO23_01840 [Thermoprotei archaeon]